jgi:hypothetical protein
MQFVKMDVIAGEIQQPQARQENLLFSGYFRPIQQMPFINMDFQYIFYHCQQYWPLKPGGQICLKRPPGQGRLRQRQP